MSNMFMKGNKEEVMCDQILSYYHNMYTRHTR